METLPCAKSDSVQTSKPIQVLALECYLQTPYRSEAEMVPTHPETETGTHHIFSKYVPDCPWRYGLFTFYD